MHKGLNPDKYHENTAMTPLILENDNVIPEIDERMRADIAGMFYARRRIMPARETTGRPYEICLLVHIPNSRENRVFVVPGTECDKAEAMQTLDMLNWGKSGDVKTMSATEADALYRIEVVKMALSRIIYHDLADGLQLRSNLASKMDALGTDRLKKRSVEISSVAVEAVGDMLTDRLLVQVDNEQYRIRIEKVERQPGQVG